MKSKIFSSQWSRLKTDHIRQTIFSYSIAHSSVSTIVVEEKWREKFERFECLISNLRFKEAGKLWVVES
ncbi:CLUMA_CG000573, isoform A [Clunio marinus]|uniref:CLUMA_CG000573, isoform A n=1 Tax=Clunio marinus TaxID=568069 RepID=A0A1J1HH48_9DIPT|nr:CLUMA_CG000573, isoform A [Clunio marinus]